MPDELSIEDLLIPLDEQKPCGISVRFNPEYDTLREARREDDETLPTGVWQHDIKRADWSEVERLATHLLQTQGKDILVAGWLGEAWVHQNGLAGVRHATTLLSALCARFPDHLHPQPEDGDIIARTASLDWVIRCYTDLIQDHIPLLPVFRLSSQSTSSLSLNEWKYLHKTRLAAEGGDKKAKDTLKTVQQGLRQFEEAAIALPRESLARQIEYSMQSREHLAWLDTWCTHTMGNDAPSFVSIQNALLQVENVMRPLLDEHPEPLSEEIIVPESDSERTKEQIMEKPAQTPSPLLSLNSREQAYQILQQVADYLAQIEPHSPVPYLVRQAVVWGGKPLPELLAELIDSDDAARRLWKQLGIL